MAPLPRLALLLMASGSGVEVGAAAIGIVRSGDRGYAAADLLQRAGSGKRSAERNVARLRLTASVPPMLTLPAILPVVPPLPNCRVPAGIKVPPV